MSHTPDSAVPASVNGARLLVDALLTNHVERVFCVPGESFLAVLDALGDETARIDTIVCRHEAAAANMAEAVGKLTGRPGVALVTRGPGATHASIGVHTAFQDSTPMILFVGQCAREHLDREAFQEIDYRRMYGELAKWVAQIDDARRIPEYLSHAFHVATSGRPGPVVLALPEDLLSDPCAPQPVLPAATTISSAPPTIVDRRIDCIVPIRLGASLPGERILPAAQRLRRAGSKPVHIEGKPEDGGNWELLQNGVRYEELRAAAQLANRNGPLNELEFSEFVSGVGQFADAIDGAPEFPDMLETVSMARELDGFAAQCDAQLSINVMSDGAPWSANYVQAVASQDGLLLSRDGTRFVKLDAKQNPVFMLQFGDTNFLRDDLTYKGGNMITLVLDVPVADEDILPFKLMCDYAKSLSDRIGARVVDDSRRPLPESTLVAIEQQLMKLYAKLEEAGIPAGSPVTRRLFSQ
ncbi:hypothetical protein F3J11_14300 [Burkholderia sp. Cy-647]|uniref:thiamine pyrophosphate-binding protein n=1 Tax=Burkholderia sp. Cy-647 TaxID=2608328 RepID=UPI00141FF5A1|nr:thiamine pyrophosphate-binding protein [Burkholderia sp. Cy-647]NIF63846.1 hypothetical protein [Burkholderia sp. Cy-647]